MNYIEQINNFWKVHQDKIELPPSSIAIYFALLHLNEKNGWSKEFEVKPSELKSMVGINSTKTLYSHLEILHYAELIYFSPARNQYSLTLIGITILGQTVRQNMLLSVNDRETTDFPSTGQNPVYSKVLEIDI